MRPLQVHDNVTGFYCECIRVAWDMIFFIFAAGFGIANPAGAGDECFLSCGPTWHKQQWNTSVNTKHHVNHQKFTIKLTIRCNPRKYQNLWNVLLADAYPIYNRVRTDIQMLFSRTFQNLERPNSRVFQDSKILFSRTFQETFHSKH